MTVPNMFLSALLANIWYVNYPWLIKQHHFCYHMNQIATWSSMFLHQYEWHFPSLMLMIGGGFGTASLKPHLEYRWLSFTVSFGFITDKNRIGEFIFVSFLFLLAMYPLLQGVRPYLNRTLPFGSRYHHLKLTLLWSRLRSKQSSAERILVSLGLSCLLVCQVGLFIWHWHIPLRFYLEFMYAPHFLALWSRLQIFCSHNCRKPSCNQPLPCC